MKTTCRVANASNPGVTRRNKPAAELMSGTICSVGRRLPWACAWVALLGVHVLACAAFWTAGGVYRLVAVLEVYAIICGAVNVVVARSHDTSVRGLIVPLAYLVGSIAIPKVPLTLIAVFVAMVAVVVSAWALLSLGSRFTFASSSYVRLQQRGPYRWIRHPQSAARLLIILASVVSGGSAVGVGVSLVCALLVVHVEENWLMRRRSYRLYASRVPFRFLPGVL